MMRVSGLERIRLEPLNPPSNRGPGPPRRPLPDTTSGVRRSIVVNEDENRIAMLRFAVLLIIPLAVLAAENMMARGLPSPIWCTWCTPIT